MSGSALRQKQNFGTFSFSVVGFSFVWCCVFFVRVSVQLRGAIISLFDAAVSGCSPSLCRRFASAAALRLPPLCLRRRFASAAEIVLSQADGIVDF